MKKFLLTICAIVMPIMLMANLFVTSKEGNVQILRNGEWISVYVTMEVLETDSLLTGQYGKINIDDITNQEPYIFQTTKLKSIEDLMASTKRSRPSSLLNEIYKALKNPPTEQYFPGGSPRGIEIDRQVANALKSKRQEDSDFLITLTVLDLFTIEPISQVKADQPVAFQIDNQSETPLFINIIDRDENGVESALFPTDSLQAFLDLYVPAYSSIRLTTYPYITRFSPANSTDQLTLVAYPLPFNLSNVLKILKEAKTTQNEIPNKQLGIYRMSVPITHP